MASSEESNVDKNNTAQGQHQTSATEEHAEVIDANFEEQGEDTAPDTETIDPLQEAQKQAAEYLNLAQRTRADLENYRRRTAREREELLRYGSERVLMDVLGVLDDVERAQEHAQDDSALSEGFRMLHQRLVNVLKQHHVTEVEGVGVKFDPNLHEALQTVASDEVEKGHIAQVYQKGYKLHDRLLRAAKVAVAG